MSSERLAPGLYLVATPIGNARDITLRALDVLRDADVLAAEDTRSARRLMELHGIPLGDRPLVAYQDHNGPAMRPRILRWLAEGRSVAYASDAGTPLVSDPGYRLVVEAAEAGAHVTGVPGASSVLAALVLAGLPSDRFLFAGFPPAGAARLRLLEELAPVQATLIFFESAKRCSSFVHDLIAILGGEREAAVCRELTKRFEEVRRGTLESLAEGLEADPPRGEVVVLVDRRRGGPDRSTMEDALRDALSKMTVKEAAATIAEAYGLPRREVYQAALSMVGKR